MSNKAKVTFYRDTESGGEEPEVIVIKRLRFRQLTKVLSLITELLEVIEESPQLSALVADIFNGEQWDESKYAGSTYTPEQIGMIRNEWQAKKDAVFQNAVMTSFRTLMTKVPEQALELLAAFGNVDLELLNEQELEVGFELAEAILKVNDLQELIERGKQFSGEAKKRFSFLQKNQAVVEKIPVQ